MVKFNPKKAADFCADRFSNSKMARCSGDTISFSREMEMVPKYLELATIKGADRFKPHEIRQLTASFRDYKTNLSRTDLLKDLLAIGSEKGIPLSAEDIKGFLKATSSMKQLQQRNVMRFLKAAKEKETAKITPDNIREIFPYEMYKQSEIKCSEGTGFLKSHPDWLQEDKIRERYEIALANELIISSNKYYENIRNARYAPAQHIIKNSQDVVKAAANAVDPERFVTVVEYAGTSPTVLATANELTHVVKLCDDRPELMIDLAKAFYPPEIKQIVQLISKEANSIPKDALKLHASYTLNYSPDSGVSLNQIRNWILEDLGLKDKLKL